MAFNYCKHFDPSQVVFGGLYKVYRVKTILQQVVLMNAFINIWMLLLLLLFLFMITISSCSPLSCRACPL